MTKSILFIYLVLCFSLTFTVVANAQNRYVTFGTYLYDEGGVILGNQVCKTEAITLIVDNRYSLTAGYYMTSRNSPYLPAEIAAPFSIGIAPSAFPQQTSAMIGLMFGRVYFSPGFRSRMLLRGGICFGTISTPSYFANTTNTNYPYLVPNAGDTKTFSNNGNNYTYSIVSNNQSGVLFNPTYEFTVFNFIGISTGIFAMVCRDNSTVGLDLDITLGKLRPKITDGE